MPRTGFADLPLHGGKAPRWLFERMVRLSGDILTWMVEELGPRVTLERFADPFWFQALGCALGFDWHSSGVTTTTCGAVKEALRHEHDLGIFAAGGKGAASRRTPLEIEEKGERAGLGERIPQLVHASRMAAKVDNNALQDGYQIYHHFFLFTRDGEWAVVQQGMNDAGGYARRYHWLSLRVRDFTEEPHAAICSQVMGKEALNLVAVESREAREILGPLSSLKPERTLRELDRLRALSLPPRHRLLLRDLHPDSLYKVLLRTYERQPEDFATLLGMPGVGAKTLRALALIAELVYGTPLSWRDPARYSFAHGGKDGHPYPVDRETYDSSIDLLDSALRASRADRSEREAARRRLRRFHLALRERGEGAPGLSGPPESRPLTMVGEMSPGYAEVQRNPDVRRERQGIGGAGMANGGQTCLPF
ncbi:DUF763 domain-containing protein [Candidatus Solincola tengchongensis]|uniref:DUF763 domain-containing protein n=1 Tax=Candidatus Solincola tengchongensis TaxID=2900693 RepID=UPI00257CB17D|nr:DUF763 domain-containing protein [Candidatus Solincola tengchongensis]